MEIVVLDGLTTNPGDISWAPLQALGHLTVYDDTPAELRAQRIGGAQAVICNKVPIGPGTLAKCPSLKYIGLFATGYNNIDIAAARAAGVVVCNVPGYSTHMVAQHTMALLLALCDLTGPFSTLVRQGRWKQERDRGFAGYAMAELYGKTFGVIGFGSIGQAAGRIAAAMGMRVLATGSRPTPAGAAIAEYTSLHTLLAQSDVVSLHCPLLPQTQGLICAETLAQMKPGALLINTARGGLVVEQDLADALKSGHIAAAGLDVTATEPMPDDCPLQGLDNCLITPHVAWLARETRERLMGMVATNLAAFINGAPVNVVNP